MVNHFLMTVNGPAATACDPFNKEYDPVLAWHISVDDWEYVSCTECLDTHPPCSLGKHGCDCRPKITQLDESHYLVEPDPVNHPSHYKWLPFEVIEITEHLNFCLGNAVKYILRADHKGKPVEDLEKAIWYLQREVANRKKD